MFNPIIVEVLTVGYNWFHQAGKDPQFVEEVREILQESSTSKKYAISCKYSILREIINL